MSGSVERYNYVYTSSNHACKRATRRILRSKSRQIRPLLNPARLVVFSIDVYQRAAGELMLFCAVFGICRKGDDIMGSGGGGGGGREQWCAERGQEDSSGDRRGPPNPPNIISAFLSSLSSLFPSIYSF